MIRFDDLEVPVKLYSAVSDRTVHFRLLHEPDLTPLEQRMVHPETGEIIPYEEIRRGVATEDGIVMLDEEELEELEPEKSRDIEITRFLPTEVIDHRWYLRPYWLGPDGSEEAYFALSKALEDRDVEGVAQWTMRNKRYQGALRFRQDYLMLVTLRQASEVVSTADLETPGGRAFEKSELALAKKLVDALTGEFDPEAYRDEYRERVLELIEAKASGGTIEFAPAKRKKAEGSLSDALAASLEKAEGEKAVA